MAKRIAATPVIKGKDAERIVKEIRDGTPRTKQREETLARAKSVFRQSNDRTGWAR
jgi:hypothetical protein